LCLDSNKDELNSSVADIEEVLKMKTNEALGKKTTNKIHAN
jgi:hypothetical protein